MNIRMMYPFFNIIGCVIFLFIGWGFTRNDATISENTFDYTIHPVGIIAWLILVALCLVFSFLIKRYNKMNPDKQIKTFTMTPPEYIEEDEMYQYATMKATKKVYTFLIWALPAILLYIILPLPFSEYGVFFIITVIIIIQNLLYFFEMRKFKEL
ncbi:hypothetical protein D1B33_04350 [Lysinibacillus yapensis]|uniref:DUF2178 domain-containing protein n=1 Tax=Ureibacillus yapensis TaxID=2304605 RepID=A0A396SFG8_9BACL|nr:hypothetical protein [Lysinibacillus yapensis]RHW40084.1 hypothetical protein D1B33_04350 [Lysinibacillus yapensis]